MSIYPCVRIEAFQFLQEVEEAVLLFGRSGVLRRLSVFFHTTDVTNTNGTGIVIGAMRPDYIHVPTVMDGTVKIDDIMITDVAPTLCLVPLSDVIDSEVLSFWCCGAMHDDFSYLTFRLPDDERDESRQCSHADDAIDLQTFLLLECLDRFLGDRTEDAVLMEVEIMLQGLHVISPVSFF